MSHIMNNTRVIPAHQPRLTGLFAGSVLAIAGTLLSPVAQAAGDSSWMVRGGISQIEPASDNGQLSVGNIEVDRQVGPSLNVAYYFTPNWAIDVLGALPFKHDFSINGTKAGTTKHLPPTVTLQYHFLPEASIQPYAGVGLNYTFFMQEKLNSGNKLKLENSLGLTAQVGVDIPINSRWRVGVDARFIDIDARAKVDGQAIGEINIDPFVYSINLGYRF